MPVMNWLSNMRNPDVSERDAKLYQDSRQGQADYLAKMAGIRKIGAETRGLGIKNQGDQLALDQQKTLNGIFAKHFDPETQKLDAVGFTADATKAGILSPSAVQTPMSTTAGALKAGEGAAESSYRIKMFDGDPSEITKPSMAPAAPTTGKQEAAKPSGMQGFFSSLGGASQPQPEYDPTPVIEEQARTLESIPGQRGELAKGGLVGKSPDYRGLLNAATDKYLGVMPKKEYFGGDIAKYQAAVMERKAKEAGLPAYLQEVGGGLASSGLSLAQGIQAKNQSAATFDQGGKLTGWAEAGVPERSMPEAVATEAKRDLATVRTLEDVATKLGKGAASDDAVREVARRLTAGGRLDINSVLGLNPSLGKAVVEEGLRKGGTGWLYSQIRGNQGQAAKLVKDYVQSEKARIKEIIKASAPGVDLKKLESYVGGRTSDEVKTFSDPSDPAFKALPKGSRFRGPDGKVRVK